MPSENAQPRDPQPPVDSSAPFLPPSPVPSRQPGRDRRGSWLKRLAWLGLTLVAAVVATELVLRLVGWGYPTSFCLWQPSRQVYTDNEKFLCQFFFRDTRLRPNPFSVSKTKPAGTVRVVVLGDSAAAGNPDPAFSFSRILERMLQHSHPDARIEVINAGMRGANSHILLPAARDAVCLKPDAFVVYVGNSEAVGLYAPRLGAGKATGNLSWIRGLQAFRRTRLGEAMEPVLGKIIPDAFARQRRDETYFSEYRVQADDPHRQIIYANLRRNLEDICRVARSCGASVVLSTVGANLTECAPFASLSRSDLRAADRAKWDRAVADGKRAQETKEYAAAVQHYTDAARLDDHFAELRFRLAQCWRALEQPEKALAEFVAARDWDALQFRPDSKLNRLIADVSREPHGGAVVLADVDDALRATQAGQAPGGPGKDPFYDHVHLTFEGSYEVARALFPAVEQALRSRFKEKPSGPEPILSREECAAQLGFTPVNEAHMAATMLRLMGQAPFTSQFDFRERNAVREKELKGAFGSLGLPDLEAAARSMRKAIDQFPDDWYLHYNLARLLIFTRDKPEVIEQFRIARHLLPHSVMIRLELSRALSSAGRIDEALWQVNEALALDPQSREARASITVIEAQRRRGREILNKR